MDFTNDNTAVIVDFELIEVGDSQGIYPPGLVWADPDIDDAARKMRLIFENETIRTKVAGAGQREVQRRYTAEFAAEIIAERLKRLT